LKGQLDKWELKLYENMRSRPSKKEYYLEIAKQVSLRSPCLRRKYGAIVIKDDTILTTGYNGPVRKGINCFEVGCLKNKLNLPHGSAYEDCPAVHAEENAIINAARNGVSVLGGILYITGLDDQNNLIEATPCDRCKRVIINAGIKKVIIRKSDGKTKDIEVSNWIKEDSQKYLKKMKKSSIRR